MNNIPKVIEFVVNNDLCIGCGICTFICSNKALQMKWDENGFFVPYLSNSCNCDGSCIKVCPFNPYPEKNVETENELANLCLKETTSFHLQVGKYRNIYAGYSHEFRLTSSSGGIAKFILSELLERGIVNHIFSVKESRIPEIHYEYAISNDKKELLATSQTKYYPVTLATVISNLNELEGKVAIVGVACFIKAIRLAQTNEPNLIDKIPFLVGIICGGVKSRFFTEYLAEKTDVPKNFCFKPEFRIKDVSSTASDYSFGCLSKKDNQKRTIKMRAVGDMWGTGLFKANACDFCDDVTTELADISLGDAWLKPYDKDGRGTNVVVTRSTLAEEIIIEGMKSTKIHLEELSLNRFLFSQQGSYNHRHKGLSYRIKRARKNRQLVPPKRFNSKKSINFDFKIVQNYRMKSRKKSLVLWKSKISASLFDKKMKKTLFLLRKATHLYHYKKAIFNKLTNINNQKRI